MRDRARQVLAYEASVHRAPASDMPVVSRVLDSLREPLVTMTGIDSWCLLLARALALAKAQAPRLGAVQVGHDGGLEGYHPGEHEERETGVILTAQLLGLLASFIGEGVTLRIVAGVWPGVTISDSEPSGENEYAPRQ